MSRIEEIENEVIKSIDFSKYIMGEKPLELYEFTDFEDVMIGFRNSRLSLSFLIDFTNKVRHQYAKECSKATLEKASESGQVKKTLVAAVGNYYVIDKESITNPENIVLL